MGGIADFVKSVLGTCRTKPLDPGLWTLKDGKIQARLTDISGACAKGQGVYLSGHGLPRPILIVRTEDDQYLAYTNRCTHIGHRKIDPIKGPTPSQPILRCCSINHSKFDSEGNRISGPAKLPLVRHKVTVGNGALVVELANPGG